MENNEQKGDLVKFPYAYSNNLFVALTTILAY